MPPKAHPGAKAKAKAKAKGKARAKAKASAPKRIAAPKLGAGGRRRAVLKRPGSAGGPAERVEDPAKPSLSLDQLLSGKLLVIEGLYWEGTATIAGKGIDISKTGSGHFLKVEVTGTSSASLLTYLTGRQPRHLSVHLCSDPCEEKIWRDGLMHLVKAQIWDKEEEDWMSNLKEVHIDSGEAPPGDELAGLRREAAELRDKKKKSRSPSRKRKDKERRLDVDEEMKSKDYKIKAKKKLEDVLGMTGLDPDPATRRVFLRRAKRLVDGKKKKKKKKRKKKGGEGSSSDSESGSKGSSLSSSFSAGARGLEMEELFGSSSTAKRVAQEFPGVLTSSWIRECQDYLMNAQGQLWSQQETEVQPLAVQFFRQQAQLKLTGAMAREYLSIAVMIDLGLQGRIAELTDVGTQRLKSLLATASGVHFSIAQKMEVVPLDRTAPASLLETREATRAHLDEERALQRASKRPQWHGSPSETPKGGKGKDGKGKKGKGKDGKGKEQDRGAGQEQKK
jgi:hypothetical protein